MSVGTGFTRLNLNLTPETTEALRGYTAAHDVNMTEAVRRAISLLAFVEEVKKRGETILAVSPDRRTEREVVLL